MKESSYHRMDRVRDRGCHIVYEASVEGGVEMRELPFLVGVLGNFGGYANRVPLGERKFIHVDRDNFNEVMKRCDVRLRLRLPTPVPVSDLLEVFPRDKVIELRF